MYFDPWLLAGGAAVDAMLLGTLYWGFRSSRPVDRRLVVAAGFLALIFGGHALLFFRGALLVLQLAFLAGLIGLFYSLSTEPGRGA